MPAPRRDDTISPFDTSRETFQEVVSSLPRGRGAGPSTIRFEALRALNDQGYGDHIFRLVHALNAGDLHESMYSFLTESRIIALRKSDTKVRPIAMGDVLARLAGKCVCKTGSARFASYFTGGAATDEEHFLSHPAPLQLGVGTSAGIEVGIHAVRTLLERHPDWAVCSNDFCNGFNAVSREAMLASISDGPFRDLLPMAERLYCCHSGLHAAGLGRLREAPSPSPHHAPPLPSARAGGRGAEIRSTQGVRQGDPLGPLFFSLALHPILQQVQQEYRHSWWAPGAPGATRRPGRHIDFICSQIPYEQIGTCPHIGT